MNGRRSDRRGYDKVNYDLHVARIKVAKGTIDCSAPRPHPLSNKGDMEQRRKHAAIDFDNRLLLDRLASIVQSKTIDNHIDESTASHAIFKKEMAKSKKRLEMVKITTENQRMLRRIQEVPPAYNHVEWEEHARENERHKRSMTIYPEYYKEYDKEQMVSKSPARKNSQSPNRTGGGVGFGTSDFAVIQNRMERSSQGRNEQDNNINQNNNNNNNVNQNNNDNNSNNNPQSEYGTGVGLWSDPGSRSGSRQGNNLIHEQLSEMGGSR